MGRPAGHFRLARQAWKGKGTEMIMMLPFVLGMLAVWFGIRGKRGACFALWVLSLIVLAAWARYHMTDAMPLAL